MQQTFGKRELRNGVLDFPRRSVHTRLWRVKRELTDEEVETTVESERGGKLVSGQTQHSTGSQPVSPKTRRELQK